MRPEYFFLIVYCTVTISALWVLWALTRHDPIEVRHVTNALVWQKARLESLTPASRRYVPVEVQK